MLLDPAAVTVFTYSLCSKHRLHVNDGHLSYCRCVLNWIRFTLTHHQDGNRDDSKLEALHQTSLTISHIVTLSIFYIQIMMPRVE